MLKTPLKRSTHSLVVRFVRSFRLARFWSASSSLRLRPPALLSVPLLNDEPVRKDSVTAMRL